MSTSITAPMLAGKADLEKLRFPVLCSPKLDGIRALCVNGKALTRKWKPIPNNHVRQWIERFMPDGVDGELLLRDRKMEFRHVTSAIMSRDGVPDFVFHVFDHVVEGGLARPFVERIASARAAIPALELHTVIVEHVMVASLDELSALAVQHVRDGYEGTMIRDPSGPYKCGRSTTREGFLLKLKAFDDEEATVVGFEELRKNENEQERDAFGHAKRSQRQEGMRGMGTLGALLLRFEDGTEFSCGSGFDVEIRARLWSERSALTGRVVKVKYQADPGGRKPGQKPRFPVFQGFRHEDDR